MQSDIFHGPILPFIFETISCMNIILWDNESMWQTFDLKINVGPVILPYIFNSVWWMHAMDNEWVWCDFWLRNKFHGPVILPYILKTVWFCMSIILCDSDSVRCKLWPQNKCKATYFTVRFCLLSLRLFHVWTSYFGIMSQYDKPLTSK